MHVGRIVVVTLSLAAIGALAGALLGSIVLTVWALVLLPSDVLGMAAVGASAGAMLGAVLAPITALGFLRRVPLGRALAQTAIGTALGALVGLVIGGLTVTSLAGGLVGAFVGFLAAAIRLRLKTRPADAAAAGGARRVD